jgi:hypothetical protein
MAGRPRIYQSVEELDEAIKSYFNPDGIKLDKPTVTGLALHLGIETHLSNSPDELQSEIELLKKAEREARKYWEGLGIKLITGDLNGSAPAWMFNMKNRFKEDWKDKVETGFTDSQGKDVAPVQIYIPSNGRDNTPAQRQPE